MEIKTLLDYEIIDIDINCKCIIKSLEGTPIICFNCLTSYEDRAKETINDVIKDWVLNGGSLKEAILRRGCNIVTEY